MSRAWFAVLFFVSGFCALVYEVVWLRLAMAAFGVNTPLVSIVLSVFMAGLAVGSWGGGRLVVNARPRRALRLYALAELCVATSGVTVPWALGGGRALLARGSETAAWGSVAYYAASGALLGSALLPFCACMGATFPFALAAIRAMPGRARAFSYLYVANVLGAAVGTLASAFALIELLGFRGTLLVAAALNTLLSLGALGLSVRPGAGGVDEPADTPHAGARRGGRSALILVFLTGLVSMGAEVVWVRQFTPYLGTVVYAFALMLTLYLAATYAGARLYRARPVDTAVGAWSVLPLLALLPLAAADPRLGTEVGVAVGGLRLALGIVPLCATLGYVTPMLLDTWSGGDPGRAGRGYAVNVIGCIAGPLLAGFVMLPVLGERGTLALLAAPLLVAGAWVARGPGRGRWRATVAAVLVASIALVVATGDFADQFAPREVRRDYTATVVATGAGRDRRLLVNGVGMTTLLPVLKVMAHLPLASMSRPPERALAICFGMGTTFRSLRTWDVDATAVELVPSVPELFGYYHPDGPALLRSPRAHVVIDDGRRFLERSTGRWDVVTIDPPPPVDGAGASLLYSREFYAALKPRIAPDGVLQQWLPGVRSYYAREAYPTTQASIARTIREAFPHVRAFLARGGLGINFLASLAPLPRRTAADLAARLPAAAAADFVEWGPQTTASAQFEDVLGREVTVDALVADEAPRLTDDHPINEYFLLRRLLHPDYHAWADDFAGGGTRLAGALRARGWSASDKGLVLAPSGSAEAVYRFDSRGVRAARVSLWMPRGEGLASWVDVSVDGESWVTIASEGEYRGASVDVTRWVAGQKQFFVRLRAAYPRGDRSILVAERLMVEYVE